MGTILTAGNSEGSRRCDAKCHDARRGPCRCVCGGRYHGRGSQAAQDQLTEDFLGKDWRDRCAELGIEPDANRVEPSRADQRRLF